MNREQIKTLLTGLTIEDSVALAVRNGLRVLPWLGRSSQNQVLMRWDEKARAAKLLSVFLAYDAGLMSIWERNAGGLRDVVIARRKIKDMVFPDENNLSKANQNAFPHSAAVFAAFAASADTPLAAADAASYSITAARLTRSTNEKIDGVSIFDFHFILDLDFLSKFGGKRLIELPLWFYKTPIDWSIQLSQFKAAVNDLDSSFKIWLDWYDARCEGILIDVDQLKQRVFLPTSISQKTPAEINAYIISISQGIVAGPLNRVRTIFIGDGEAGKTSLIRVLNEEAVVEGVEAKTPGIDIHEWQVPDTEIKASFWDFGGQVMVHATHQLFLRESCLYVLLVSAREKEKATERAEYWLEHVKSFGKSAPVLIVANKADKESVRLDESLLLGKYPGMIKGFFQLACTEAQGAFRSQFEQFKQAFCQQLQAVGLHQVQFQKAHFAVLSNLRQRTPSEAFLTHQDYATLCQENRVDEHGALDSSWLLDILDKLGIIVHFPDMPEMEEYILNPRWLTYGIYTIMYNEQPRMTRAQVIKLLAAKPVLDHDGNQLNYAPGKCHIIFEAMRRYKLCYFLRNDPNQIIIPALLPSDIKQHGFDTSNALEFRYDFESFLPRYLISELIVECHEDIANINDQEIVWQHGALLHNTTHRTQALIQADYHFRRLTIWLTQQPAAADYLAILRDRVERIVQRIDINYKQNIRLPKEARLHPDPLYNEVEWANFKLILAQRNRGQTEYVSESETVYSIGKILGVFTPQATGGNTTIYIQNSNIAGDITAGNKTERSFNQGQP